MSASVGAARSYDQLCPSALALDLVGDRWTLLVVRELGVRPCGFSDLRRGLPGVPSNLLSTRLAKLVDADVIVKAGSTHRPVYELTPWGDELFDLMVDLGRWGARLLPHAPGHAQFQGHYLVPLVQGLYGNVPRSSDDPSVSLLVDFADEPVRIELGPGGVFATVDPRRHRADVVLSGDRTMVLRVLAGLDDPTGAEPEALRRLVHWTRRAGALPS